MAMDEIFDKLRKLQDILSKKIELEQDIQEIPKILSDQEEVLLRFKQEFVEKNREYETVRAKAGEFRNLLFEAESAREKAEKNIGSSENFNMREYEILEKTRRDSADKEQQYRRDVQREERNLSDLDGKIKNLTSLIEQQESDLTAKRKNIDEETEGKKAQFVDLENEEKILTSGLDSELLFKFDRIIRHKMGKGIVSIKGGMCAGCHMILPAQFANRVRQGEEIVFCPYCSRILYYEESDKETEQDEYFDDDMAGSLSDLEDLDDEEDDEEDNEEEKSVNLDYEE